MWSGQSQGPPMLNVITLAVRQAIYIQHKEPQRRKERKKKEHDDTRMLGNNKRQEKERQCGFTEAAGDGPFWGGRRLEKICFWTSRAAVVWGARSPFGGVRVPWYRHGVGERVVVGDVHWSRWPEQETQVEKNYPKETLDVKVTLKTFVSKMEIQIQINFFFFFACGSEFPFLVEELSVHVSGRRKKKESEMIRCAGCEVNNKKTCNEMVRTATVSTLVWTGCDEHGRQKDSNLRSQECTDTFYFTMRWITKNKLTTYLWGKYRTRRGMEMSRYKSEQH